MFKHTFSEGICEGLSRNDRPETDLCVQKLGKSFDISNMALLKGKICCKAEISSVTCLSGNHLH